MATGTYTTNVTLPIEEVWNFVGDMDHWAPLVSGYQNHQKQDERTSTWELGLHFKGIEKKIKVQVITTDLCSPTSIRFTLKSLDNHIQGNGHFLAQAINLGHTRITGYLNISARGVMRVVINSLLQSFLPHKVEQLTERMASSMCRQSARVVL